MRNGCIKWTGGFTAFLLLLFALPFVSFAETGPSAGFAPSIWMSRANVVAGESVNIFTVLYNGSDNAISGDVIFAVDGASIGTKNFTLAPGETQTLSVPWIAKAGSHTVSARIEKTPDSGTNATAAVLNETTGSITVSIDAPPPPSPAAQVLNTVTSAIEAGVASSAPAVMSALASLYDTAESFRVGAKSALEKQVAGTTRAAQEAAPEVAPEKAGARNGEPESALSSSPEQNNPSLLSTAGKYAALAGLAVVSSKTLFYISLALVVLLLIQILRVSLRERRYRD